jgi:hypothetical protein
MLAAKENVRLAYFHSTEKRIIYSETYNCVCVCVFEWLIDLTIHGLKRAYHIPKSHCHYEELREGTTKKKGKMLRCCK